MCKMIKKDMIKNISIHLAVQQLQDIHSVLPQVLRSVMHQALCKQRTALTVLPI